MTRLTRLMAGMTCLGLAPLKAADLFNNFNTDGTLNGAPAMVMFILASPAEIREVVTYHWNNGIGKAPGGIALKSVNAPVPF